MSIFKLISDPAGAQDVSSSIIDFYKVGDFNTREYNIILNLDEIKKLNLPRTTEIEIVFISGETTLSKVAGTVANPKNFRQLNLDELDYKTVKAQVRFFEQGNHRTIASSQLISSKSEKGPISAFIKMEAYPFGDTTAWAMNFPTNDFPTLYINQEEIEMFNMKLLNNPFLFSLIIPSALIQSLTHFLSVQNESYDWVETFKETVESISNEKIPSLDDDYEDKLEWANTITKIILGKHKIIQMLNRGIGKYEE